MRRKEFHWPVCDPAVERSYKQEIEHVLALSITKREHWEDSVLYLFAPLNQLLQAAAVRPVIAEAADQQASQQERQENGADYCYYRHFQFQLFHPACKPEI